MCKYEVQEYLAACAMLSKQQNRSVTGEETMNYAQSCDTKAEREIYAVTARCIDDAYFTIWIGFGLDS